MMRVQQATPGVIGCDTAAKLNPSSAAAIKRAGMSFIARYLSLGDPSQGDLTTQEVIDILAAGLCLFPVQHVRYPGWSPTAALGSLDGAHAFRNAMAAGIPPGATVWLDLEGVAKGNVADPRQATIDYANAWHRVVKTAGYSTGVYVGAAVPLSASDWYNALETNHYWASFSDVPTPSPRGFCLRQLYIAPGGSTTLGGVPVDIDVTQNDWLGGAANWVVM